MVWEAKNRRTPHFWCSAGSFFFAEDELGLDEVVADEQDHIDGGLGDPQRHAEAEVDQIEQPVAAGQQDQRHDQEGGDAASDAAVAFEDEAAVDDVVDRRADDAGGGDADEQFQRWKAEFHQRRQPQQHAVVDEEGQKGGEGEFEQLGIDEDGIADGVEVVEGAAAADGGEGFKAGAGKGAQAGLGIGEPQAGFGAEDPAGDGVADADNAGDFCIEAAAAEGEVAGFGAQPVVEGEDVGGAVFAVGVDGDGAGDSGAGFEQQGEAGFEGAALAGIFRQMDEEDAVGEGGEGLFAGGVAAVVDDEDGETEPEQLVDERGQEHGGIIGRDNDAGIGAQQRGSPPLRR